MAFEKKKQKKNRRNKKEEMTVDWRSVDFENDFSFAEIGEKKGGVGISTISFLCKNAPFVHQTPPLTIPFARSDKTFSLPLSFDGMRVNGDAEYFNIDGNELVSEYFRFITNLEDLVKKKALEKHWFGNKVNQANIDTHFKALIQTSESSQYAPRLRTKLKHDKKTNLLQTKLFGLDGKVIEKDQIDFDNNDEALKGKKVIALLECSSVWYSAQGFGLCLYVKQLLILPPEDPKNADECLIRLPGEFVDGFQPPPAKRQCLGKEEPHEEAQCSN